MTEIANPQAVIDLLGRIEAGESLQDILRPIIGADEEAVLKRVAVPRTFDRDLFDEILAVPNGPTLEDLRTANRIEPVGGMTDAYRVRKDMVLDLLARWWPGSMLPTSSTESSAAAPADLRALLNQLVEYHTNRGEHLEVLYHQVLLDQVIAKQQFEKLYNAADKRFDLAACQDVIAAVGMEARPTLIGPALRKTVTERMQYLRVRGDYATDYYRTASFFKPAGFERDVNTFLYGRGSNVVQVIAEGGMGKTMRIRWLIARKCIPERIPVARIDFDDIDPIVAASDPWLVLLEIALQLHDQIPGGVFEGLAKDYGRYRPLLRRGYRRDPEVGQGDELSGIRQRAELDVPDRVRNVLRDTARDKTVVIILDTTEELLTSVEPDAAPLWRELKAILDERPRIRLIVSGRYDLAIPRPRSDEVETRPRRWTAFRTAFPRAPKRYGRPFSVSQAEAFLRSRGIRDKALIRVIVPKSRRRPFNLALFVDILRQNPGLKPSEIAAYRNPDQLFLVERVLDHIPNPGVRWLLRYGVVPRRLTLDLAVGPLAPLIKRGMAGNDPRFDDPTRDQMPPARRETKLPFPTGIGPGKEVDIEALWLTLRQYAAEASWVSMENPTTLRFQPEVIVPMREILRDQDAWRELQSEAAKWFETQADEHPEYWGELIAEAAYHRFQLDRQKALAWWQSKVDWARALGKPDWVRRLADEARQTATKGDQAPDASVIAEFELVALDVADAARREALPTDARWLEARQRLARLERLDAGQSIIPAGRLAFVRATVAVGLGETDAALAEVVQGLDLDLDDQDGAALTTLRAEVLAETGGPASTDALTQALSGLAALARSGQRALRGTIATSIESLGRTELRGDRIAEAIEVYENSLVIQSADGSQRTETILAAADLEARFRRPGAALVRLEAISLRDADRGQWLRRETVRARAELAARRPLEAVRVATSVLDQLSTDVLGSFGSSDVRILDATAREIRGEALGTTMQHDEALNDLDQARGSWSDGSDPESGARALVLAATIQMRGRGDLIQARQLLDGLESSQPPHAGEAWTDGQLRRAELYARIDDRKRAAEIVDETLQVLVAGRAGPSRHIRAAIAGLTDGADDAAERHLGSLIATLENVGPGSIRLALLRDVQRVPNLAGTVPDKDLRELRRLGHATDPLPSPIDAALAEIRCVEVERITGDRDAALARLRVVAVALQNYGLWHAVTEAAEAALRLDEPDLAIDLRRASPPPDGVARSPLEDADLLARIAPFLISRDRLDEAEQMLDEAAGMVDAEPRGGTAARVLGLQAIVFNIRGDSLKSAAAARSATEMFRALGDSRLAANVITPAPTGTRAVAQDIVQVRVEVRGPALQVDISRPAIGGSTEPDELHFAHPVRAIGNVDNPDAPPERALKEVIDRLGSDWRAYGMDLGMPLRKAGLNGLLDRPLRPVGITLETAHRLLPPVPWELAIVHPEMPISLDPRVSSFVRGVPGRSEGSEDVRYAQATLERLTGESLAADGVLGPLTRHALERFQKSAGLPDHGGLDADTLAAMRRRVLESNVLPPRVVLVRTSFALQVATQTRGYDSAFGVDLYRIYESAGFRVELLETPNLNVLASIISDPSTAIVHFAAGIRLTTAGIASLDFAESTISKTFSEGPELTASVLGRALASSGYASLLVVIDVPRPESHSEASRQLIFRNRFAADLFEQRIVSTVLATGLMEFATADSHLAWLERLSRGESVGDACSAARHVSAPGPYQLEGLPDAAALAAIALFARTPNAGIGSPRVAS